MLLKRCALLLFIIVPAFETRLRRVFFRKLAKENKLRRNLLEMIESG